MKKYGFSNWIAIIVHMYVVHTQRKVSTLHVHFENYKNRPRADIPDNREILSKNPTAKIDFHEISEK